MTPASPSSHPFFCPTWRDFDMEEQLCRIEVRSSDFTGHGVQASRKRRGTARAVHLRHEGNGITLPHRRRTPTRLSMENAQDCGYRRGGVCGPAQRVEP